VAFGTFILWAFFRARAKEQALPPGSPTATNIKKAISTGQLPEHASAELWQPELITILIQEQRWAWFGAVFFGLATVLGIFVLFDTGENPWLGVACSVMFLGLAVGFPLWVRRRRPRIQKLLDQFPEEESLWR
jgi:Flp pilus assembly protein TadB